jgi:hypothetical protein
MSREKKPEQDVWPPGDRETWFGGPRREPTRHLSQEIVDFLRETADPSEFCEGKFYESDCEEERSIGTLPPTPEYIKPLNKIDLPGKEWKRIVVHVMRRLAKWRSDLAQKYACDIEIFAALKEVQSKGDTELPGYMDPAVLAIRLENDAPIVPEPTKVKGIYLQYVRLRDTLRATPRERWSDLLRRVELDSDGDAVYYLNDEAIELALEPYPRKRGRNLPPTAQHVALEVVSTLFNYEPDLLRQQFASARLPLRMFAPSKRKQREMRSLPIKKLSRKIRSPR